ncbi:MAG TPA: 50S ribosomal protein L11 methyltransferase [Polyangiaceae bacterium]|nr:50S ribosomal protein L11 methyltransferase [Polyangiaceae bacterium]
MQAWSSSDFPYQCLLDSRRTRAFQAAIRASVKPGDIVVDAGAGSGILSFFAAEAGAGKVYAVEVDPALASCLTRSARANGFQQVIEVVQADIQSAPLPRAVDVLICEMMDTGLMEEMQVSAVNSLFERGVLAPHTRCIPCQYETFLELGCSDFNYYGHEVLMPRHDWPHLRVADAREEGCTCSTGSRGTGWLPTGFHALSDLECLSLLDLQQPVSEQVDVTLAIPIIASGVVNAVRISARARLCAGLVVGATNALNGDKVLPLDAARVSAGEAVVARIRYRRGGGLASFAVECSPA